MILPRRAAAIVLLASFLAAGAAVGQAPPFADDERAARVAERYEAMLASNPAEGMALDRLWKMYEERGATGALLDQYRHATDTGDKPADALVYGHLLKRAGRLDEAAGSYDRAARLDPANPLPCVAQADLFLARKKPAEAAASLEQALSKATASDRRRADWLLKLGDAWLAADQPLKASGAWEQLAAAHPSDLALQRQLAANYEKNGLPDRAIAHYEYIDQHADPAARAAALRELGRLYEARGSFDAARDALERGLALTARDNWMYTDLQTRLIRLYQRAGKAAELAARWQAAVAQTPRDLGSYERLVALAEAQGDPAAAQDWLEKAVALAPHDRENTLKLARLLADQGEGRRAAALYDNLLKTQPSNLEWILARAELDVQAGQTAEAVARIEARLAPDPADDSVAVPALQFFLVHHLDDAAERLLAAAVRRQPQAVEPALALAKFYLARGRAPDAHAVLDRLTMPPGDPAALAQRWAAAAGCYKDAGESDEALRCWQQVAALQPGSPETRAAIGELYLAKGDLAGGTKELERAIAAAPTGPEREELDHKLFQALLDRSPDADTAPAAPGRWRGRVLFDAGGKPLAFGSTPAPSSSPPKEADQPLPRYLEGLEKTARSQPSAPAYLRLARWLQWAHRPHDAGLAAGSALALDAGSIAAREILADVAIARRDHGAAIRRLNEIAALDPKRKPDVTKRVADLLLEDGAFDGALVLLDRRVEDEPGSAEALADLALAQQRADRWFDALATWERAYALPRITPAQRANLRQPLIAAYEHLGRFQQAAQTIQAAVDAQDDLAARQDLFRELVTFSQGHGLTGWLDGVYKAQLAAQPQDYFVMTAAAALEKAEGDPRSAYALLDRAYYSAPDPAAALRTLVAEAESLGENEAALTHQQRLVALPGQSTAENLQKLATLEETNLNEDAAARTWEQVATRFSRDTAALGSAADYFARSRRVGRARELLAAAVALDPADYRRQWQLAQLDRQADDPAGERACLEAILDRTPVEKAGDPLVLPRELDPATEPSELLAAAGRGGAPARKDTAGTDDGRSVRLQAIGESSRLLFAPGSVAGPDERRRWLERWQATAKAGLRSEPLTALYRAGQADAVVDLTASWLPASNPLEAERIDKIFLLAALRTEHYPALARWVWNVRPEARGERSALLTETLQYFLSTGGRPGPEMVSQVFPAGAVSRADLWQAAGSVFADKHWYPQAVELGERALAMPAGTLSADAFQLARWELDAGRLEGARAVLRKALDGTTGASYEPTENDAVMADLRAGYLLLPAAERAGFAAEYLRRAQTGGGNGIHAALAAALLHGLGGDEEAAVHELDRIVDLHLLDSREGVESTDVRRWNYLFACGAQLEAWHLDRLAAHAWRRGLSEATVFDRHDAELSSLLGETRLHALVAETLAAEDPQEARERVTEYLQAQPTVLSQASAALALLNAGQQTAAIQIYERLQREVPVESDYPRALLSAQEAAGDLASVDAGLAAEHTDNPATQVDTLVRRARLAEVIGQADRSRRLLLQAWRIAPASATVLRPLTQALGHTQQLDDCEAVWREAIERDPSATSIDALADLEIQRGQKEAAFTLVHEATELRSEPSRGWWTGRRVNIYLAAGHLSEAVDLLRQQVRAGETAGLVEAAPALARQQPGPVLRELLASAVRAARDPLARYQVQAALVKETCTARDVPAEEFRREMRRLQGFAEAATGQQERFLNDRSALAMLRGATDWLEGELKREWDEGRGEVASGSRLANLYFEKKQWDPLRRVVEQFDARPNLPEPTLASLATRLVNTGHADWALPILDRLSRRFPQNADYVAARATALWRVGRHDEAAQVLDVLDAQTVFDDDFSGRAASVYLECGDRARAVASLERTVYLDPLALRSAPLYCRLAALYLEDHRLEDAYRLLAIVYRNPAQADMGPLVDYLAAAGRLKPDATGELPGGELPLTFLRRAQLLAAAYERMAHDGHGGDAFRLVAAHPELLPAVPALVDSLRRNATPAQVPALTKLVEAALKQADEPSEILQNELAKLYVRRSELAPGEALNFLSQAYGLIPDDPAVACPLAAALRSRGQEERANTVLAPFLAPGSLPSEQTAARLVLASK
ncbi:MAG: hypothetical protein INR65_02745 [Gluconacetobacter diazotrophicus]|nr:hypothetical protein [Gluconacetobacter diazotrophicus]